MSQILKIDGNTVSIGIEDGTITNVPIATINYPNPQVGDEVQIFQNEDNTIVSKVAAAAADSQPPVEMQPQQPQEMEYQQYQYQEEPQQMYNTNRKSMNKHVFVWVCTFLVGSLGVDRFVRGQIGLGILKLLTCGGIGIWSLVDFIIGLVKVYGEAFANQEDVVFINGKYAR